MTYMEFLPIQQPLFQTDRTIPPGDEDITEDEIKFADSKLYSGGKKKSRKKRVRSKFSFYKVKKSNGNRRTRRSFSSSSYRKY